MNCINFLECLITSDPSATLQKRKGFSGIPWGLALSATSFQRIQFQDTPKKQSQIQLQRQIQGQKQD